MHNSLLVGRRVSVLAIQSYDKVAVDAFLSVSAPAISACQQLIELILWAVVIFTCCTWWGSESV